MGYIVKQLLLDKIHLFDRFDIIIILVFPKDTS